MDTMTHMLTDGVIARATDDEKIGNWGTLAGLAMGFFPDSDFVLGLFNRQFYLEYHPCGVYGCEVSHPRSLSAFCPLCRI